MAYHSESEFLKFHPQSSHESVVTQAKKVPLLGAKTPFGEKLLNFCKNITK